MYCNVRSLARAESLGVLLTRQGGGGGLTDSTRPCDGVERNVDSIASISPQLDVGVFWSGLKGPECERD